jgi:hypothetical protein
MARKRVEDVVDGQRREVPSPLLHNASLGSNERVSLALCRIEPAGLLAHVHKRVSVCITPVDIRFQ